MSDVLIKINGPHCQSSKVVKNGNKTNGKQNCYAANVGSSFSLFMKTRVLIRLFRDF